MNHDDVKADLFAVLDQAPEEASYLLHALYQGRIDGGSYRGECCCLIGTIAKLRGIAPVFLPPELLPDSGRLIEQWCLDIRPGMTPANSQTAALAAEWIKEWAATRREDVRTLLGLPDEESCV